MSITIAQICNAVESTLGAAATVKRSQSYDGLTEGMQDFPTLQIYPEAGNQDPGGGNTDRTTFKAGVRQTELIVHADYYARQRSHLGEDMAAIVNGWDAITNELEKQDSKPYFGLDGLQAFKWTAQRVIFEYGDPKVRYTGVRFVITFRIF